MKSHKTADVITDIQFKMPKNIWFQNRTVLKKQFLHLESSESSEVALCQKSHYMQCSWQY